MKTLRKICSAIVILSMLVGFLPVGVQSASAAGKVTALSDNEESYVAEGVDGTKYTSLTSAFEAGGEITLLTDVEEDVTSIIINKHINLDLNGHSVDGTLDISFQGYSSFSIKDSEGEGKIKEVLIGDTDPGTESKSVSIKGGSVGDLVVSSGSPGVTISGGKVSSLECHGGSVTISGGEVGQLSVVGGTVTLEDYAVITEVSYKSGTLNYTATSLTLDPTTLSLDTVHTKQGQIAATINTRFSFNTGGALDLPVTWTSSDPDVATVSASGGTATVTAVGTGTATITATSGGKTATCTVTVKNGTTIENRAEDGYPITFTIEDTIPEPTTDHFTITGSSKNFAYRWYQGDQTSGALTEGSTTAPNSAGTYTLVVTTEDTDDYAGGELRLLVTVNKQNQGVPNAPTQSGSSGTKSITINSVSGQRYAITDTNNTPDTSTTDVWETATSDTLTFNNLAPGKQYYIWTYLPETETQAASQVSNALEVYTSPEIISNQLDAATVGQVYTATLTANSQETITWNISDTLPDNLTWDASTATISGTPITATTSPAKITVTATVGNGSISASSTTTLELTVNKATLSAPENLAWDSTIPGRATWSAVTNASGYSVQLYKDGSACGASVSVSGGNTRSHDFQITEAGSYTFTVKATGGADYSDSLDSNESASLNYYTVTFNTDGGSTVASQIVVENSTATAPQDPVKEGYSFDGWYGDSSLTTVWNFDTPITEPTTLYAKWSPEPEEPSEPTTPDPEPSEPTTPSEPEEPSGPSTGDSDGWTSITDELDKLNPDTQEEPLTIEMNGETEVPKEVFETIAGKDVDVVFDMGDGVSWSVNGADIPADADLSNLDLGVSMNTDGIPVEVINAITGEATSVQLTLAHDGDFGFALTLSAPLGEENAGYWANLYHYDEANETMDFETAALIDDDGTANLRMTHASQYAIVIDDHPHETVLPFTDVNAGDWFYDPVVWAYDNGLMTGTSATTFEPNTSTTRAMIVAILNRFEDGPTADSGTFTDVADGDWYADAVNWAASVGIVAGFEDGSFRPNAPITREQMAAILYNYAQWKGYDVSNRADLSRYSDQPSPWATDVMQWAVAEGLITGTSATTLDPQGHATRAQVAAILERFLEN